MALPTVSSTFLDRVVAWVSPEAGMKRLRARAGLQMMTGGGYRGGKRGRRATQDWQHGSGSADADLLPDLVDLRGRSRDLARNNSLATGAVSTKMTNVVGSGLVPRSAIDRQVLGLTEEAATAWEAAAQGEFALAAKSMDWSGVQHFYELQQLWFRGLLESGDMLVINRFRLDPGDIYGVKVQSIEADRLSNPNWGMDKDLETGGQLAGGVQTDVNGVPVAYHVSDRHPGGLRQKGMTWRAVPARYSDGRRICLHLYERLREGQTRGVPFLAPVIEDLKELGTYTENEARAAAVASLYTVFITTEEAGDGNGAPGAAGGTPITGSDTDIKLGSGAIVALAPGEEVTIPTAGRPNPAFDAFVTAFCRQIGVALNLPYELLIKHFTASYSASRAALEIAWQTSG